MKKPQPPPKEEVRATVVSIAGPTKSRYAVTYPEKDESIPTGKSVTFSLSAWKGLREPLPGQNVILSFVEEFAQGLRARSARPVPFTSSNRSSR